MRRGVWCLTQYRAGLRLHELISTVSGVNNLHLKPFSPPLTLQNFFRMRPFYTSVYSRDLYVNNSLPLNNCTEL